MTLNIAKRLVCYLAILSFPPDSSIVAQTGWVWQNPLPTGNILTSARYTSEGVCVILGDEGTVITSPDNGFNWQVQTFSGKTGAKLNAATFAGSNIYVAVGDSGRIIKTTDKGIHWQQKNSGTVESLTGISAATSDTFFAVGSGGTILTSTDAGETWTRNLILVNRKLNGVSFADHNIGIVVGDDGLLMRTTDGGLNWNTLSVTTYHLYAIEFIDGLIATIVGGKIPHPYPPDWYGTILRTTNAGLSWSTQGSSFGKLSCVSFGSKLVGIAAGEYFGRGSMLRTTDGGISWTSLPLPETIRSIAGITLWDAYNGLCVYENLILATSDGGNTWQTSVMSHK